MQTLTLVTWKRRPERGLLRRMELEDEHPRVLLFEDQLGSEILPQGRGGYLGQIVEAYRRRHRYDAVLTWGDPVSLLFALALKLGGARTRHIALMGWMSPPKKALLLKLVHSHIDQIITWSSVQRAIAVNRLGIPASKISLVPHPVDQRFWRPLDQDGDIICAVGNEMRDYPTLIEAMRGLAISCQIAAHNRVRRPNRRVTTAHELARLDLPSNVEVSSMTPLELRALVARSRFVVIPLRRTDSDNGITSILEAMAMGKAVISTRVPGHVDTIRDGTTGILVPQGDAPALRQAIQYLWEHPLVAERMGAAGRRVVEDGHALDRFVEQVRTIVEAVITEGLVDPTLVSAAGRR